MTVATYPGSGGGQPRLYIPTIQSVQDPAAQTAFRQIQNVFNSLLLGLPPTLGLVFVDDYGGVPYYSQSDAINGFDSTAAFNAALAALPTMTVYQNNGSGTFITNTTGVIVFSAGYYKVNSSFTTTRLNPTGPFVTVTGLGRYSTQLLDFSQPVQVTSCTMTSGSKDLTTTSDFIASGVNQFMQIIASSAVGESCLVQSVNSSTDLTMSQEATNTQTITVTFVPFFCVLSNYLGYPGGGSSLNYSGSQWCGGGWRNLTIDGSNTQNGVHGLALYSGEDWIVDIAVQNYLRQSTGGVGLAMLDNYWIEGYNITLTSINCHTAIEFFGRTGPSQDPGSNSQSQGTITLHVGAALGQNGIIVRQGAWLYNATIIIKGSFTYGNIIAGGVVLTVRDANSKIEACELHIAVEADQDIGGGSTYPGTFYIDNANGAQLINCWGDVTFRSFTSGQSYWVPVVFTGGQPNPITQAWSFSGTLQGDTTLTDLSGNDNQNALGNPSIMFKRTNIY